MAAAANGKCMSHRTGCKYSKINLSGAKAERKRSESGVEPCKISNCYQSDVYNYQSVKGLEARLSINFKIV